MLSILHHAAGLYHSFTHLQHSFRDAHDEMASGAFQRAIETVEHLHLKLPEYLSRPRVGIVCGSGLGGLADVVNKEEVKEWEYKDVPNFPLSTGMHTCEMADSRTCSTGFVEDTVGMEAETSHA